MSLLHGGIGGVCGKQNACFHLTSLGYCSEKNGYFEHLMLGAMHCKIFITNSSNVEKCFTHRGAGE